MEAETEAQNRKPDGGWTLAQCWFSPLPSFYEDTFDSASTEVAMDAGERLRIHIPSTPDFASSREVWSPSGHCALNRERSDPVVYEYSLEETGS